MMIDAVTELLKVIDGKKIFGEVNCKTENGGIQSVVVTIKLRRENDVRNIASALRTI